MTWWLCTSSCFFTHQFFFYLVSERTTRLTLIGSGFVDDGFFFFSLENLFCMAGVTITGVTDCLMTILSSWWWCVWAYWQSSRCYMFVFLNEFLVVFVFPRLGDKKKYWSILVWFNIQSVCSPCVCVSFLMNIQKVSRTKLYVCIDKFQQILYVVLRCREGHQHTHLN